MSNAELPQPAHGGIEPMVLKMKPLANPERRRARREGIDPYFRSAVLADEPHVKMTIIGGALSLLMARRPRPGLGQVEQAVPLNPFNAANHNLRRTTNPP